MILCPCSVGVRRVIIIIEVGKRGEHIFLVQHVLLTFAYSCDSRVVTCRGVHSTGVVGDIYIYTYIHINIPETGRVYVHINI